MIIILLFDLKLMIINGSFEKSYGICNQEKTPKHTNDAVKSEHVQLAGNRLCALLEACCFVSRKRNRKRKKEVFRISLLRRKQVN